MAYPKKTIEQFAIELNEVHGGKIVLAADAEYITNKKPIKVVCTLCNHAWAPRPSNLLHQNGCGECALQRARDNWGRRRRPAGTTAEKAKARQLRADGWTYEAIAIELNRSRLSIRSWCDPKVYEKKRAYRVAYNKANRERKNAIGRRYYHETEHAKTDSCHKTTLRKRDLEAEWIGLSPAEQQQILDLYKQRDRMNKEAGYVAFHIDHIYPVAKGGAHAYYNLRIITAEDNISKGARLSEEDWSLYQMRVAALFTATN